MDDKKDKPDPEMLANLDLLLQLDTLESESDWELMQDFSALVPSKEEENK